jgi:hypothetical protein
MTNTLSQSTGPTRLTITKPLSVLAVTALVLAATFSRADSDRNRPEHNTLAGTWICTDPGTAIVNSYMSDGRVIDSGGVHIGPELGSPAQGEWIRTGHHEFAATLFCVLSSPTATHYVKFTNTLKLNETSDELTLTAATISVFSPDGTLQAGPFSGSILHFKRVVVGH